MPVNYCLNFLYYRAASHLAANPLPKKSVDAAILDKFENLFKAVNGLLG